MNFIRFVAFCYYSVRFNFIKACIRYRVRQLKSIREENERLRNEIEKRGTDRPYEK